MGLFVCFDDSYSDPTYSSVDSVSLVETDNVERDGNPCVGDGVIRTIPILPNDYAGVSAFAEVMGWKVEKGADGKIVLITDIE